MNIGPRLRTAFGIILSSLAVAALVDCGGGENDSDEGAAGASAGSTGVGGTGDGGGAGGAPKAGGGGTGGAGGSGGTGGAGGSGGPGAGCRSDADCAGQVPETSPANCATAKCDVGAGRCTFFAKDADADGVASAHCQSLGGVPVEAGLDCDDGDPEIKPNAAERCNNKDDDCDGNTDEDIPPDQEQPCVRPEGATEINMCRVEGFSTCVAGAWTGCTAVAKPPQPDNPLCDGKSWDCNNTPDEGCICNLNSPPKGCTTSPLGCPGTQTCTNGTWGQCNPSDPGACQCATGEQRACTGSNSCPGTETCVNNVWSGSCPCNDPSWECAPGTTRNCTNSQGCGNGTEVCAGNGHWSGQCAGGSNYCPPGWSNANSTCTWTSAHQGAYFNWGQSSCANNSLCATYPLDSPTNGSSNDLFVEVVLNQSATGCTEGGDVANWVGCLNPDGSKAWGRDVTGWDFKGHATIQLRCPPGTQLAAFKYSWGHCAFCGCTRGMTIQKAENHDPPAATCVW
ncbi:MAG TPA: putative metal-binding motif-containing protein [Polyangiaceae bacterium]|nr:putative metal-binding motif-containing protein [Polyangiaceae bacterium]